jgi:hypothetical protein
VAAAFHCHSDLFSLVSVDVSPINEKGKMGFVSPKSAPFDITKTVPLIRKVPGLCNRKTSVADRPKFREAKREAGLSRPVRVMRRSLLAHPATALVLRCHHNLYKAIIRSDFSPHGRFFAITLFPPPSKQLNSQPVYISPCQNFWRKIVPEGLLPCSTFYLYDIYMTSLGRSL